MKKVWTVCIMLVMAASVAFAGVDYDKERALQEDEARLYQLQIEELYAKLEAGHDLTVSEKDMLVSWEESLPAPRHDGLDAQGGPDAYGYTWVDDQAPDTATYNFIDIASTGTLLAVASASDGGSSPVSWGWNFPFYGANYTSANVIADGLIQFTVVSGSFSNSCTLPSASRGPALFVFWDDLDTRRGGTGVGGSVADSGSVYFQDFGTHAVFQWDSVGRYSPQYQHTYTFQAVIYPNGRILYQYREISRYAPSTTEPSPTIAIQGVGAGNALTYFCSTASTPSAALFNRAVWFLPPLQAPSGRCCYLSGGAGACDDLPADQCLALGGQWGGAGTTCAANPCPLGRCCYLDAAGAAQCATVIQLECTSLGGAWASGLNCADNPCPIGRCCYDNGASCADVTELECNALAGSWLSTLTCTANPCPIITPGGDNCATAVALAIPSSVQATTTGGTDDDLGADCPSNFNGDPYVGSNTAPDKWYSIVGTGNTIRVSLCSPNTLFDTQIVVYCGPCEALTCVGGNDDAFSTGCSFSGTRSIETFCSQAGATYYVVVDGWSTGNGQYELSITDDGVPCVPSVICLPVLGSCCYNIPGGGLCDVACIDEIFVEDCAALGGVFTAEGSCEANPCPRLCVCECATQANAHAVIAADETTYPISSTIPTTCVTINVPFEYHITDLNVCVDILHTYDSDMVLTLQSPNGTVVVLSDQNGGSSDNMLCTEFDDEAVNPVGGGSGPFNGSWIPDEALSAFDGENAVGDWLFCVEDLYGGDNGSILGVCLKFEYDEILPVAFGSFDAVAGNGSVTLNWNTESESNVDHFELSRDGSLLANVTAQNNATGATYTYTDADLNNGTTYTYDLVSVDVNGARQALATLSASPNASAAVITEYALHQNYPNPFNPTTNLTFDMVDAGHVSISVFNIMGQKVAELVNGNVEAGRHIVSFDATGLSSGLYLYKMEANGFTAQNKMVLMK